MTKLSVGRRELSILAAALFLSLPAFAQPYPGQSTLQNTQNFIRVPPFNNSMNILLPSSISYSPASTFLRKYPEADLSLSVTYNYTFTFNLQARDQSVTSVNVPDGWYALTMAVVAKEREGEEGTIAIQNRFITANSRMFVPVVNGTFNADVALKFRELAASAMLDDLYIELIPLRKDCGQKPCIQLNGDGNPAATSTLELLPGFSPFLVKMNFVPFIERGGATPDVRELAGSKNPFGGKTLERFVWETRQLREQVRLKNKQAVMTPEQYALANGLRYISIDDMALANSSRTAFRGDVRGAAKLIEQILNTTTIGTVRVKDSYRKLMPALCETLAAYNSQYQQQLADESKNATGLGFSTGNYPLYELLPFCAIQPGKRLRLSRVTHVGEIDRSKPVKVLFNPQLSYLVSTSSIKSRSQSWDATRTGAFKPFSALFKLLDGVGLTFDYTQTVSTTNSRVELEQGSGTMTDTMDFNPLGLSIPTLRTRNCLQVVFINQKQSPFYDSRAGALNGLYICSAAKAQQNVQEIYAHVFTANHDSSLVTAYAPGTQSVNRSLRGDVELSGLFWSIRSAVTSNHGDSIFPSSFSQAAETYFASTAPNANRVVVAPVMFEQEVEPSIMEMALGTYRETFLESQPAPSN